MYKYLPYIVAFSHCPRIGPLTYHTLISHFSNPKMAYEADVSLIGRFVGPTLADTFEHFRANFNPKETVEKLLNNNIHIAYFGSSYYPKALQHIPDPPICLYARGNASLLYKQDYENNLAIVGTRKPTSYGIEVTRMVVAGLTTSGFCIVSGMAMGIDAVAHQTCLTNKASTIAVLGTSVDEVYPKSHTSLYSNIIRNGGLVVSEFPPGTNVVKGMFITRNRIVTGLSRGVVIVEGTSHSGTLITARYALAQGRDVFAVPGPITSDLAKAPNTLIQHGATPVLSVNSILETFSTNSATTTLSKDPSSSIITQMLARSPHSVDMLALASKLTTKEVLQQLTQLELAGEVVRLADGTYSIKRA